MLQPLQLSRDSKKIVRLASTKMTVIGTGDPGQADSSTPPNSTRWDAIPTSERHVLVLTPPASHKLNIIFLPLSQQEIVLTLSPQTNYGLQKSVSLERCPLKDESSRTAFQVANWCSLFCSGTEAR